MEELSMQENTENVKEEPKPENTEDVKEELKLENTEDVREEPKPENPTSETQDPYLYTKMNDFTSEIYKIEIENLPNYFGHGQIRKLLNGKLKLNTHKIKAIGNPPRMVFVTFRDEMARDNALKCLDGYRWKGKDLRAKKANPMADPLVKKRKAGDSEDFIAAKKGKKDEEDIPISLMLKNVVTPWWNKTYDEQLLEKETIIKKFVIRLGKELKKVNPSSMALLSHNRKKHNYCCSVSPIKPSPLTSAYRNKCEFTVGRDLFTKERTVGFRLNSYKEGSMSVAAPDDCINVSKDMLKAVKSFEQFVRSSDRDVYNPETHVGYWRQLTLRTSRNGDLLLIVVMHPQTLSEDEIATEKAKVKDYFENGSGSSCGITSLYFQLFDKRHSDQEINSKLDHLLGKQFLEESLLGMTFQISPEAFFQINVAASELLYRTISDAVGNKDGVTVLDICCGTGTIGLFLAKEGAKVIGIEMCPQAVANARTNAEINGISSVEYMCGKAEDVIMVAMNKSEESEVVAIANPPRAGLHGKVVKRIRASENIKKLVYVSCHPNAAFFNFIDLCRPTSNNYRGIPFYPVQVSPVDMFPHTPHYELVLVFARMDIAMESIKNPE